MGGICYYSRQRMRKCKEELEKRLSTLSKSHSEHVKGLNHDNKAKIAYLNDIIDTKNAEIKDLKESEERKIEETVQERMKNAQSEMESAVQDVVNDLDTKVGEQMRAMITAHTLNFQCACSKNPADMIPCYIDFTKENEFQCKKCGAKYRVEFSAYPVLLTKTIDESILADEIQKQLDEKFGK